MSSAAHLLFSYGTLQLDAVQTATFGRVIAGEQDAIVGFQLGEVQITDPQVVAASGSDRHPALITAEDPAAEVDGMVFRLDDAELAAADEYEVDAYVRVRVPLRSGRAAWTYVLADTTPLG
jgi:gamma-glutamylcyclotransferase (GGCT)/AIG2-like uncharacterized protein YtfP